MGLTKGIEAPSVFAGIVNGKKSGFPAQQHVEPKSKSFQTSGRHNQKSPENSGAFYWDLEK
ncbi:MAG: hypothetical protein CSA81_03805 [Acidobacteria bacterium]|nr:MAG: hypothetical protein CSA81_03805 [Acidobacteriota bacterium]